jgi:hypothetical protein
MGCCARLLPLLDAALDELETSTADEPSRGLAVEHAEEHLHAEPLRDGSSLVDILNSQQQPSAWSQRLRSRRPRSHSSRATARCQLR